MIFLTLAMKIARLAASCTISLSRRGPNPHPPTLHSILTSGLALRHTLMESRMLDGSLSSKNVASPTFLLPPDPVLHRWASMLLRRGVPASSVCEQTSPNAHTMCVHCVASRSGPAVLAQSSGRAGTLRHCAQFST